MLRWRRAKDVTEKVCGTELMMIGKRSEMFLCFRCKSNDLRCPSALNVREKIYNLFQRKGQRCPCA